METKTLQTSNIPVKVFNKAKERAKLDGFSSIHDVIRLFLANYAEGKIRIIMTNDINSKRAAINF